MLGCTVPKRIEDTGANHQDAVHSHPGKACWKPGVEHSEKLPRVPVRRDKLFSCIILKQFSIEELLREVFGHA
jgi:hypothetical protein